MHNTLILKSKIKCKRLPTAVGCFPLRGFCVTSGLPYDSTGIDNEWRKTQCMPREVCIDVGKEFGAATNTFFKPPCVSVYRCGGCCNSEGLQCMNTSTGYLSKTVGVSASPGSLSSRALDSGSDLLQLWSLWSNLVQFRVSCIFFGKLSFQFLGFDDMTKEVNDALWTLFIHGIKAEWRK